jgi:hypothetical protein
VEAFTSKEAANERAPEKRLAAPGTFPVRQARRREIVCDEGQREYQTGEKQKVAQLQHKRHEKADNEEAQSTVIAPCLAETRAHKCILDPSSCISKAINICI